MIGDCQRFDALANSEANEVCGIGGAVGAVRVCVQVDQLALRRYLIGAEYMSVNAKASVIDISDYVHRQNDLTILVGFGGAATKGKRGAGDRTVSAVLQGLDRTTTESVHSKRRVVNKRGNVFVFIELPHLSPHDRFRIPAARIPIISQGEEI